MKRKALINHRKERLSNAMQVYIDRVMGVRSSTCDRLEKSKEHLEYRYHKLKATK